LEEPGAAAAGYQSAYDKPQPVFPSPKYSLQKKEEIATLINSKKPTTTKAPEQTTS